MKALVLKAINHLVYEDVPTPRPKEGEVLLKIKASGICGSDIARVFTKGTYSFPTIPGHEFAGQIVEVGRGVNDKLIGKKAAVLPLLPCKKCDMCEIGEYASCRNYNYFGSRCDGGFAEYLVVPVWNLVMCEGELSYEEMAMAEPAAVSLHALSKVGVELGNSIAIFGAGAIGLMLAEFAKAWGAGKVILLDIDERKLAFAKEMGYKFAINNASANWQEEIMAITNGKGTDIAIEGAGVASALGGCLNVVKPQGKVVLMGNPIGDMNLPQHDYWEVLRKQLTVVGTWNSSYTQKKNDWQIALDTVASGKMDVKKFITHKYKLENGNEAFEMVRDRKEFSNRVMFIME
ncbi:MAG: dehydrogenase [Clostridia bacterium]|jgi:L-iditol 2-dehydrogenase|nr:dehydrogenase [Clostridia bacterium]